MKITAMFRRFWNWLFPPGITEKKTRPTVRRSVDVLVAGDTVVTKAKNINVEIEGYSLEESEAFYARYGTKINFDEWLKFSLEEARIANYFGGKLLPSLRDELQQVNYIIDRCEARIREIRSIGDDIIRRIP